MYDPNKLDSMASELYAIYCRAVGGVAFNGEPLPAWDEFAADKTKARQVNGWRAMAKTRPRCEVIAMHQNPHALCLRPRNKWFSAPSTEQANGWRGPFRKLEEAASRCWLLHPDYRIFVAQGRKLTVAEIEEQGADYTWEVDSDAAFEIVLPKFQAPK
jgi:hypothetical protein